ncbi:hypothetical protein BWL79_24945 [Salmonella enterica]|nr:hypothetical protein [Salmonella enterica]EBI7664293.1 hypothetical protein [Salmonella enterica]EBM6148332.1 hypothetical protein [Salmonella enterica]
MGTNKYSSEPQKSDHINKNFQRTTLAIQPLGNHNISGPDKCQYSLRFRRICSGSAETILKYFFTSVRREDILLQIFANQER